MQYEYVTRSSREIEVFLKKIGGEGRSIHELISSVSDDLPEKIVKKARFVATIRNKLLHESGFELSDELLERYMISAGVVKASLVEMLKIRSELFLLVCHQCNRATRPILISDGKMVTHSECGLCSKVLRTFSFDSKEDSASEGIGFFKRIGWFFRYYLKVFIFQYLSISVSFFVYFVFFG